MPPKQSLMLACVSVAFADVVAIALVITQPLSMSTSADVLAGLRTVAIATELAASNYALGVVA